METQNTIAVPSAEDDEITIYSSTQDPTDLQVNIYLHKNI